MQMTDNNTDLDLVEKFIAGDESAFNKLILKYQDKIYWHARRMTGNHLDADEVVQEVLLVLFKKLKSFQFKSSLYTWIYRITVTRSINFINRRKVKQIFSFEDQDKETAKSENDIIKNIEDKEKLKKLDMVLQKLPAKQREVFIMRNYEELSYEEIAEITGKSTGALKANYFHSMKKITELMKEYIK